jgi:drug/metabolite transporter (DMT)-like permease
MFKGIAYALSACLIWGLIFIVPQFMVGFSPFEVALGRFICYGSISLLVLAKMKIFQGVRYSFAIWLKATFFSLFATMGYYTCVVLSVRNASPAMCALILGISPITIAFYGNWKQREISFRKLIFPSVLIIIGLLIINAPHLSMSEAPSTYIIGLIAAFLALIEWSWFVVANAKFLKDHPEISSTEWCTLIGVTSLFWVALMGTGLILFEGIDLYKYSSSMLVHFVIGCSVLGFLCSWVGNSLWNRASFYLPVSLAGQLSIFETIFGLLFFYFLEWRIPPQFEIWGIALLLIAIAYGIRTSIQAAPQHA